MSKPDPASPPPYTPHPSSSPSFPASASSSSSQTIRPHPPPALPPTQQRQGEYLLPVWRRPDYDPDSEEAIRGADWRAMRRFVFAFLWALAIWMMIGFVLGGAGAMDYGRDPEVTPRPRLEPPPPPPSSSSGS